MTRLLRCCAAAVVLAAAGAAPASALVTPDDPPEICASDAFSDQVGTDADDQLAAERPPARLYGLDGDDTLTGARNRATCLFGGRGRDTLELDSGGGIAWGELGGDTIVGSPLSDIIDGGRGVDQISAGDGDDKVTTRDNRPDLVNCGEGADIAKVDRVDLLLGCESIDRAGRAARRLKPFPRNAGQQTTVRVRFRVPRAAGEGAYRLIYLTPAEDSACPGGAPAEVARLPGPGARVSRGQRVRIGMFAPQGGWCLGAARVALLRYARDDSRPPVPVARFSFRVR